MILSGSEIKKRMGKDIIIKPFSDEQLNPNSYNLKLHNELLVYKELLLDAKRDNPTEKIIIPDEGYVLKAGELYLARTVEYTETRNLVPMIIGRSSLGRLGVTVHITSGFGDIGFCGYWTLQLTCIKDVRIYPNMKICQIYYQDILGNTVEYNSKKYQGSNGIMTSQMYQELNEGGN